MSELLTRRLTLRPTDESDTELLARLQLRDEVKTHIGEFRHAPKGAFPFTIARKGVRLGHVAVVPRHHAPGTYELVCALLPEAEGCGIATEVGKRILEWASHDLGLKEIFASIQHGNAGSLGLATRLEMTESRASDTTGDRLFVKSISPAT